MKLTTVLLTLVGILGACASRAPLRESDRFLAPAEPRPDARASAVDLYLATDTKSQRAYETEGASVATDLAQKTQNPLSDLISLPLQSNTGFSVGPNGDETVNDLNIQPVIPFELNKDWRLITRTILPVKYVPEGLSGNDTEWGLGDTNFTAFFTPINDSKWIWGVGPVIVLPTSTARQFGAGEWGAGASAVALTMPGKWVFGALVSNFWTFDGSVNTFFSQYFVNYNLANGWYLSSAPIIT